MNYKSQQKERLEQVISETLATTRDLEKRAGNGEPREPLERESTRNSSEMNGGKSPTFSRRPSAQSG
jgi:hypothetical protein